MTGKFTAWLDRLRPNAYRRRQPLILINGLAEQSETWFRNQRFWRRSFDVFMPNLLAYEGAALHRRIDAGEPISVDYLVEQLHRYLDEFVQAPPYHIVASSLGGKVAVEFAVRHPELVSRMVLLCPSGMGDVEQLPIVEGVRRSDLQALVDSVYFDRRQVDPGLVAFYRRQFTNRRWRSGLLRTIRGTMDYSVRDRLPLVQQPTLLVSGREDRIVDPQTAAVAARALPNGHFLMVPHCGHAPHMERPWMINRLVVHFLTHPQPTPRPRLAQLILTTPSTLL
jgi:pimeloyl-ACP methyl ester carboxylesterase